MPVETVKVCSHGQIVQTMPHPDTRIWHRDTQDFCTDRPETLKTGQATLTLIPGNGALMDEMNSELTPEKLRAHIGHNVVIIIYGRPDQEPVNVALECEDCSEVLADCDPA